MAHAPRPRLEGPSAPLAKNEAHEQRYAGGVGIIANCLGCPYREGVAIGTRGNTASPIVLVGEAPGAKEVDEGQPFVGRAGTGVLGCLFFHIYAPIVASPPAEVRHIDLGPRLAPYLPQIWPRVVPLIRWPPLTILTRDQVERIWPGQGHIEPIMPPD
jgi:hypothetical protein